MSNPLLIARESDSAYACVAGDRISAGQFVADILCCAESLPSAPYLINLCSDRYQFSVAFFAAAVRGQTNLLPAKRGRAALLKLREQYPDVAVIGDATLPSQDASVEDVEHVVALNPGAQGSANSPRLDADAIIAVAFTSGSTGQPQPHSKSWGMLARGRQTHARYLPGDPTQLRGLVATVPSWHMYGLEWALLLPTASEFQLFCGNDFFPQDVLSALATFTVPTTLISTPLHLKALLKSPKPQRPVRNTLSATAPLATNLARQVQAQLATELFEIYGCSELGSLAYRHTVTESTWQFFDDLALQFTEPTLSVKAPELPQAIELADRFALAQQGRYELLGRASDIVKVGGKRESLANLNNILLGTRGIEDGVFYEPSAFDLPDSGRLAALVVAPTLSIAQIRARLAAQLEPAFVPRPIHQVAALPRANTSKLQRDSLLALVHKQHGQ